MVQSPSPSARPLAIFFDHFQDFTYNPQNHASAEIGRLLGSGLWGTVCDDDDEVLFDAYRDALTMEFNDRYGTDAKDLSACRALCERIGLDPIPATLEECREEVTNTHVNLVNLVHVHGTDHTVERFASVYELSAYTIRTKKYFPKENANSGNLLKFLLRYIFDPEQNNSHRKGARGRKGGEGREGRQKGPQVAQNYQRSRCFQITR